MPRHLLEEGNTLCPVCGESKDRLSRHWSYCEFPEVGTDLRTLLTGVLLGGGSLQGNGENTKHLLVQTTNETLARWLFQTLDWLAHSLRRRTYDGDRRPIYHVRTHSHPYLDRQRAQWYDGGEKQLQSDVSLTPASASVWWGFAGWIEWNGDYESQVRGAFSAQADARAEAIMAILSAHGYDASRLDRRVAFYGDDLREWLAWTRPPVPGVEYKWATDRPTQWILRGYPAATTVACPQCDSTAIYPTPAQAADFRCQDCGNPFDDPVRRASRRSNLHVEAFHACIRAAALVKGEPLTVQNYQEWRDEWGPEGYPSADTISGREGWNRSCREADVESGGPPVDERQS